jgi:hypothetical protein
MRKEIFLFHQQLIKKSMLQFTAFRPTGIFQFELTVREERCLYEFRNQRSARQVYARRGGVPRPGWRALSRNAMSSSRARDAN